MRTTVDIDDDVLEAARAIALARRQTVGTVISDLVRHSLPAGNDNARNGIPLISTGRMPQKVTLEIVNTLRDEPA
jgi:hypothetical protein